MIAHALSATLSDFLTGLFLALLVAISCALVLAEARKERHLPEDEHDDEDWRWPARKVGPMGRTRIEDRRA